MSLRFLFRRPMPARPTPAPRRLAWDVTDKLFQVRLRMQQLEDRTAPATFTVTTSNDSGAGSIREAILSANATPGLDTIDFSIGSGTKTISPVTPLPSITEAVLLDATTQPGYTGTPLIQLDGSSIAAAANGLFFNSNGSTVRGLSVINWTFAGILISGDSNLIQSNYLGVTSAGTAAGNVVGVAIFPGSTNVIGTNGDGANDAAEGNVISANSGTGIYLQDTGISNVIAGNIVGLNPAGTAVLGTQVEGVRVFNTAVTNTQIGTNGDGVSDALERNVISGNTGSNIRNTGGITFVRGNYIGLNAAGTAGIAGTTYGIAGSGLMQIGTNADGTSDTLERNVIAASQYAISFDGDAFNSTVHGNYIGVSASGSVAITGGQYGVFINSSSGISVGGTKAANRNVIANQSQAGVQITGATTNNITIAGNLIGTNAAGDTGFANDSGVVVDGGANNNLIGGTSAVDRNIISGNTTEGVYLAGAGTSNNRVQGNYIGTNVSGTGAIPNNRGIYIENDANSNIIGTDGDGTNDASEGNLISGNAGGFGAGIQITNSDNIVIAGNIIGLQANGTTALGNISGIVVNNTSVGVRIGTDGNGTSDALERNIISGNSSDGIWVANSTSTTIAGNFIGTDSTGAVAKANNRGVIINSGSTSNTVGGASAAKRNVISGNTTRGIEFGGATTTSNQVLGNYIGTDVSGTIAIGNTDGILIDSGANTNTVGGTSVGARNVISGNSSEGIDISGTNTIGNVVIGNIVGLDVTGTLDLGNVVGVEVDGGATNNTIGGIAAGSRNIISGNSIGVQITGATTTGTFVQGNYIGTNESGTGAVGNSLGLNISAPSTTVGGGAANAGNVISGNTSHGVQLSSSATNIRVQGNRIGTTADGTTALGNVDGIFMSGLSGGTGFFGTDNDSINDATEGNLISGNVANGIRVQGAISGIVIAGNRIGTDVSGATAIANFKGVVLTSGANNNTIGGTTTTARNVISGNTSIGIEIGGGSTTSNLVLGNFIGTNAAGTAAIGNNDGIELNSGATTNTIGGSTAAERNIISGNNGTGISISNSPSNTITGNYIGTDVTGQLDLGNVSFGIALGGSSTNTAIGGSTATPGTGLGNVISGNNSVGVMITLTSNSTTIYGNIIGLGADGSTDIGNTSNGIQIETTANTIGNAGANFRNVISGNGGTGIAILNSTNRVYGNYIGTDITGTLDRGNSVYGVSVQGAPDAEIGSFTNSDYRNIISGNDAGGVLVQSLTSTGTGIFGNYIGTNAAGTGAIPNLYGVVLAKTTGVAVGGPTATLGTGYGNIIAGNSSVGVFITSDSGTSSTLNPVQGNVIGLDSAGNALSNGTGVKILDSDTNRIGSTDPLRSNVISGNTNGVVITGSLAKFNIVEGNSIGTNAAGAVAKPNTVGVLLENGAASNTIGGTTAGARNVLSGNTTGINIDSANSNTVLGNFIGLASYGLAALPNTEDGITLNGTSASNTIGSTNSSGANYISGNTRYGIAVTSSGTSNTVIGNIIGLNTSDQIRGNGTAGITNNGGAGITVGGTAAGSRNVISGNPDGIWLVATSNNVILNNYIGTDSTGSAARANTVGIVIDSGSTNNTIGGADAGSRNIISGNTNEGIQITGAGATSNRVYGNYIGLNAAGTGKIANNDGIFLTGNAEGNFVGTDGDGLNDSGEGNVISGNTSAGVLLISANNNRVAGNIIGLNAAGSASVPNFDGVFIQSSTGNIIGTDGSNDAFNASEKNIISGNADRGVVLGQANIVAGNWIGLLADGTSGTTQQFGIQAGGSNWRIGTNADGIADSLERNVIGGNTNTGLIVGAATNGTIAGNYIGTDATGSSARPNLNGITVSSGATSISIGGSLTGAGNVISGNTVYGIRFSDSGTTGNTIAGNLIGTDAAGNGMIAGLVARYRGEGGSAIDDSAGVSHAAGSGYKNNAYVATGLLGWAFQFDGLDDYDQIPNTAALNPSSALSLGAWIQPSTTVNSTIIEKTGGYSLRIVNGKLVFSVAANATMSRVVESTLSVINDSTWKHVAATFDASTQAMKLFIDGSEIATSLVSSNNVPAILATTSSLTLGASINSSNEPFNFYQGLIDELGIYNRAVTESEWAALVRANLAGQVNSLSNSTGIRFDSEVSGNTVGGATTASRNVISANSNLGIHLAYHPNAVSNTIRNNFIGTDVTGTKDAGNRIGIRVESNGGTIANNVISANDDIGFDILGGGINLSITGNLIGTDVTGMAALGNVNSGISIQGSNNTIGGTTSAERNVISASSSYAGNYIYGVGIVVTDYGFITTKNNSIIGNFIGTDITGLNALGNSQAGIFAATTVVTSVGNKIGGSAAGEGNVIAGNGTGPFGVAGVWLSGSHDWTVQGNFIGTDKTGQTALPNAAGIWLWGSSNIQIGGSSSLVAGQLSGAGNVISGNRGSGINFNNSTSFNNSIQGNFIGTDVTGTVSIGNNNGPRSGVGINVENGRNTTIGGTTPDLANLISGNNVGVQIIGSDSKDNSVIGNWVGTDSSHLQPLGNNFGIAIALSTTNNRIGGSLLDTDPALGNKFAFNTKGIWVTDTAGLGNTIRLNQVYSNGGPSGIINDGLPATPNLTAALGGDEARIFGGFVGVPFKNYQVDYYTSDTAGSAKTLLGTATYTADGVGVINIDQTLATPTPFLTIITAVATRVDTLSSSGLSVGTPALGAIIAGIPLIAVEGTPITLTAFTVLDTNGLSYQWAIRKNGLPYADIAGSFSPIEAGMTFIPDDNGPFDVTLTLTLGNGTTNVVGPIPINVTNARPRPELRLETDIVTAGSMVTATAAGNDPGTADTIAYGWQVWYGPAFGPPLFSGTGSNFNFTPTNNGFYRIRLTATDDDGGVNTIERLVESRGATPLASIVLINSGNEGDAVLARAQLSEILNSEDLSFEWTVTKNGIPYTSTNPTETAVQFVPNDQGTYRIDLRVRSLTSGIAVDAAPLFVTPANVAPRVTLNKPVAPAVAGAPVTFTASAVDPGSLDTLSYRWTATGIGSSFRATGTGSSITFTPPAGGRYQVEVIVSDNSNAQTRSLDFLTVAAGTLAVDFTGIPLTTIAEGQTLTLSPVVAAGNYVYDWTVTRNGLPYVATSSRTVGNPGGLTTTPLNLNLTLTDDGNYDVTLSVRSATTAVGSATKAFSAINLAPNPTVLASSGPYLEGQPIWFTATANDPGTADTHTYQWSINGVPMPADPAMPSVFCFFPPDNGIYTAQVIVTDDGGLAAPVSTAVNVDNQVPELKVVPGAPVAGQVSLALEFKDVPADTMTSANWQLFANNVLQASGKGTTLTYVPVAGQRYTVTWTASDEDGGSKTITFLSLVGTAGSDVYQLTPAAVVGVQGVIYQALGGNDFVQVDPAITIPVTIDGGAGNDTITGGSGNDSLIAGTGNNLLFGGKGNDVFIGGGSDTMNGGQGDDRFVVHFSEVQLIDTDGGTDTVDFSQLNQGISYNFNGTSTPRSPFGTSTDTLSMIGTFEGIVATRFLDRITVSTDNTTVFGGEGDDQVTVDGGTGIVVNGDAGSDQVEISNGEQITVFGGDGSDSVTIDGSASIVQVIGGETLTEPIGGTPEALNVLIGGGDQITIFGGEGDEATNVVIDGSATNVVVQGEQTPLDVTLSGGEQITIFGGEGEGESNVVINGDATNVVIVAESTPLDVIVSAGEQITIFGGEGEGESNIVIDGSATNVVVVGEQTALDVTVAGGEQITIFGGEGSGESNVVIDAGATGIVVIGQESPLDVTVSGGEQITIFGGEGSGESNVVIDGGAAGIVVVGQESPLDVTVSGGEQITIFGGEGSGESNVVIDGAAGIVVVGQESPLDVTVSGGEQITIFGGEGEGESNVVIDGGAAGIVVVGQESPLDVTVSGGEQITVFGGEGEGDTNVVIDGSATGVVVVGQETPLDVTVSGGEQITVFGGEGDGDTNVVVNGTPTGVVVVGQDAPLDVTVSGGEQITIFGGEGEGETNVAINGDATNVVVSAGGGNDTVSVSGGEQITIFGGEGEDQVTIDGTATNVIVAGGSSADGINILGGDVIFILGDSGNDSLNVTGGEQITIFGGEGDDNVTVDGSATNVLVSGWGGNEVVFISGGEQITVFGGEGEDNVTIDGDAKNVIVSTSTNNDIVHIEGGEQITVFGGEGEDNVTVDGGASGVVVSGDQKNDTVVINGGEQITVFGGEGDDTVTVNTIFGAINVLGSEGTDTVNVLDGTSVSVDGGLGNDIIGVQDGEQVTIFGGSGDDKTTVSGGLFIKVLGDSGNDRIVVSGGEAVTVNGGTGNDVVFADDIAAKNIVIFGDTGNDYVWVDQPNGITVSGGRGDDIIVLGRSMSAVAYGDDGDDIYALTNVGELHVQLKELINLDRSNLEQPSRGQDFVDFSSMTNSVSFNLSMLIGSSTPNYGMQVIGFASIGLLGTFEGIYGTPGNDVLIGNSEDNQIYGFGGDDTIFGFGGNDTLVGGTGNDAMDGGADDDWYVLHGTEIETDTITEAADTGIDTLDFSSRGAAVTVNLSLTTPQTYDGIGTVQLSHGRGLENVIGTSKPDTLTGNSRNNQIAGLGGNDTLTGGIGDDVYYFAGSNPGVDRVVEFGADLGLDTLDFSALQTGINLDLNQVAPQYFGSMGGIELSDAMGVENVVGTSYRDTLLGNARPNTIHGNGGADTIDGRDGNDHLYGGLTQIVYLDFISGTDLLRGDFDYLSTGAAAAIVARLQTVFTGLDYRFTFNKSDADLWTASSGREYVTLVFNDGPGGGIGGEANELDFRNLIRNNRGTINVNDLLGNPGQPTMTTANVIALSATIAAHELGHMAGLRHGDAFGPIGTGLYAGISSNYLAEITPTYTGSFGATTTPWHIMASPGSVGITLFDSTRDTYFGERELIKLAFNETGTALREALTLADSHGTFATAIGLGQLPALNVYNTMAEYESVYPVAPPGSYTWMNVGALSVSGTLVDSGGVAEKDMYSFFGNAGDIINIELISSSLRPPLANPIDGVLRVFNARGQLLYTSDNDFETSDAFVIDLALAESGQYFVEVSSASPTDTGRYELFLSRFGPRTAGTPAMGLGDTIIGGAGSDHLEGTTANDTFRVGGYESGDHDTIDGRRGDDTYDHIGYAPGLATLDSIERVISDSAPPLLGPIPPRAMNEGETLSFVVNGSSTVIGDRLTYTLAESSFGTFPSGATIDAATGRFVFTPTDEGNFSVTIVVTNLEGLTAERTLGIFVENVAPTLSINGLASIAEGDTWTGGGQLNDPGQDSWTVDVDYGDGGGWQTVTLNLDRSFALSHAYADSGSYVVQVRADDGDGGYDLQSFTVNVENLAPTATVTNTGDVVEGSVGLATINVTGMNDIAADAASLRFAYDFNNDGVWDLGNGTYVGSVSVASAVVPAVYVNDGFLVRTVKVRVIDKDGDSSEYTTSFNVFNAPPTATIESPAIVSVNEGSSLTLTGSAFDLGHDTLTYLWTATSLNDPTVHTSSTTSLTFTPTDDQYTVSFTVTDSDGASVTQTVIVNVLNVAPTISLTGPATVAEGAAWVGGGSVNDPGLDTLTVEVNFGDGWQPVTLNPDRTFILNHVFADNGSRTVEVRVNDGDTGTDTETLNVIVTNSAPTVTLTNAGDVFEGSVGLASVSVSNPNDVGADAGTLRFAYDFNNDGIWDLGTGIYAGSVSAMSAVVPPQYVDNGPFVRTVKVRVLDKDGGVNDYFTQFNVVNAPPMATINGPLTVTLNEGGSVSLTGFGTDPGLDTLSYSWTTLALADPTPHTSSSTSLAFTTTDDDVYQVFFTITDFDGASTTAVMQVVVNNVAPVVSAGSDTTVNAGVPFSRTVSFTDPGADTWTAEVNYGDGAGWQSVPVQPGKTVNLNKTYTAAGAYTVQVRVTDDNGGTQTQSFVVTVNNSNTAPVLGSITGPSSGVRNTAQSFTFTATDAAIDLAVGLEYRINWGDGSPVQIVPATANNGTITVSHTYTSLGTFTISAVAVDPLSAISNLETKSFTVELASLQTVSGLTSLLVTGDNGDDTIFVKYKDLDADFIVVRYNGVDIQEFRWRSATGTILINRIEVRSFGGNDDIRVENGITLPTLLDAGEGNNTVRGGNGNDTILAGTGNDTVDGNNGDDDILVGDGNNSVFGGNGNDTITAGSGNDAIDGDNDNDLIRAGAGLDTVYGGNGDDILLGEAGNDVLYGQNGRDLVIGGTGADYIYGNNQDDILIAGYTLYDNVNASLMKIMSEWTSANSFTVRINNLKNGTGLAVGVRLDGNAGANQTVFSDNDVDTLIGSNGSDWFFANTTNDGGGPLDIVQDLGSGDSGSDIDGP